jgi:immunoglobulin-like protein involved in spore germination
VKRPALVAVMLLAACGGLSVPSANTTIRPTIAPTSTPPPPATSAAPLASALASAKGSIVVRQPLANARVHSPVAITGDASVFEAALQWRITDSGGRVLAQGSATASAGAPGRGTFAITATFPSPATDTIASVEVYDRSPRDGTIDEIVRVPVVVTP